MSQATQPETTIVTPDDITSWFYQREGERDDDSLEGLAQSLSQGQEEPVIVRETDDGLQGIVGYRRVLAVDRYGERYGIDSLRAEVREYTDTEAARSVLVTDVFTEPLSYMDQARLVDRIHEDFDTQQETADFIGKSVGWVSKKLSRLSDPEEVQEAGEEGVISEDTASAVAQEDDPTIRRDVIDYARENPEATRADIRERLNETQQADTDADAVGEIVEEIATLREKLSAKESQEERRQEIKDRIADLEERASEIRTEMPESEAARYEELEDYRKRVSALQDSIDLTESVIERLEDSAESAALSESEESKRRTLEREINDLASQVGRPTENAVNGDSEAVQVQETNGEELWTIRVRIDPDDPPEVIADVKEKLENQVEKRREKSEYDDRIRRSESLSQKADEVSKGVDQVLEIDTIDLEAISPETVDMFREHRGSTLAEMRDDLDAHQEEMDEMDAEALEEAAKEYDELVTELSEVNDEIESLRREKPPDNTPSLISQYRESTEDKKRHAREVFNDLPAEKRESVRESLEAKYGFSMAFLNGEDADTEDDETDVSINESGGGWYEITDGTETLKVQGQETAEAVAEAWESDGSEAASEIAN